MHKLILIILFKIILYPILLHAAIAEVGSSSACDSGTALVTSLSCAHDSGSTGSDRITILGLSKRTANDPNAMPTYGGQNMTFLNRRDSANSNGCEIYYLVNPPTGSNNGVVTFAAGTAYVIGLVTFSGVNQSTPMQNFASAVSSSAGTTATVDVTATVGNLVIETTVRNDGDDADTITQGASQTQQWNDTAAIVGSTGVRGEGSTENGTTTTTMSSSWANSQHWSICAAEIVAAINPVRSFINVSE